MDLFNAVLFVLIGLEVLMLSFTRQHLILSVLTIPVVLISRFIAVGVPMTVLRSFTTFSPGAVRIMTWGGLRGGISIALALSIPPSPERQMILTVTYAVVVFSILVQGTTIKGLVNRIAND